MVNEFTFKKGMEVGKEEWMDKVMQQLVSLQVDTVTALRATWRTQLKHRVSVSDRMQA